MHKNDRLDELLEQLARTEVPPPATLQQAVGKRIAKRHRLIQWTVMLCLFLNGALFIGLIAVPWLPGLTLTGRSIILLVESTAGSVVILALLAARDQIGPALHRLELLVTSK